MKKITVSAFLFFYCVGAKACAPLVESPVAAHPVLCQARLQRPLKGILKQAMSDATARPQTPNRENRPQRRVTFSEKFQTRTFVVEDEAATLSPDDYDGTIKTMIHEATIDSNRQRSVQPLEQVVAVLNAMLQDTSLSAAMRGRVCDYRWEVSASILVKQEQFKVQPVFEKSFIYPATCVDHVEPVEGEAFEQLFEAVKNDTGILIGLLPQFSSKSPQYARIERALKELLVAQQQKK